MKQIGMHTSLVAAILVAVASPVFAGDTSPTQSDIAAMHADSSNLGSAAKQNEVRAVRGKAVFEAAETYSAQTSFCERAKELNAWAETQAGNLDTVFNFSNLLLDGGRVLPPVIEKVDSSYKQDGDRLAVTAKTTWYILDDAKIVSTAPSWRTYLHLQCSPALKPNPILLPGAVPDSEAADEIKWKEGVDKGWKLGRDQAMNALKLGLARMTRDYRGMLTFKYLYSQGVVSAPVLASGNVGVRVDGRTLSVDEKVFRLTSDANWNKQADWSAKIKQQAKPDSQGN